jgi:hypothetical protein
LGKAFGDPESGDSASSWDTMLDLLLDIPRSLVNGVRSFKSTPPLASGGSTVVLKSIEESLKREIRIKTQQQKHPENLLKNKTKRDSPHYASTIGDCYV